MRRKPLILGAGSIGFTVSLEVPSSAASYSVQEPQVFSTGEPDPLALNFLAMRTDTSVRGPIPNWEAWLGRPIKTVGTDVARISWASQADPERGGRLAGVEFTEDSNIIWDMPTSQDTPTLSQIANGVWDNEIIAVAQNMIDQGAANAQLRWNHEPDGFFSAHNFRNGNGPVFRDSWQRVHGLVMAIPGAQFSWEYDMDGPGGNGTDIQTEDDPELGTNIPLIEIGYPGNAYVDTVTTGSYCRGSTNLDTVLNWKLTDLDYVYSFARSKGKKFGSPEWGMWVDGEAGISSPGDNVEFIQSHYDFFMSIPPADRGILQYFNINQGPGANRSDLSAGDFPLAEQRFLDIFGVN